MPDVYLKIADAPAPTLANLMNALELRAADPQLRAMLAAYLGDAELPRGARVLEVGCGTGAVTRSTSGHSSSCWPPASKRGRSPIAPSRADRPP